MKTLQDLSAEWIEAKETEREAVERRRMIEDEIGRIMGLKQTDEESRKLEA